MQAAAARNGLAAKVGRLTLGDYAKEVVEISRYGLTRQGKLDADGRDETVYLDPLAELVRAGRNPATSIIENWEGRWNRNVDAMIEATAYR